ncbi:MAG: beta-glucosidase [Lachnospiraceae bacterium]|nr:beta-glucosidase [Lachnospiraceae bacterium]
MFREDFVWGVASSSYQVEGKDPGDGSGKSVWDTFTEGDAPKTRGHNGNVSCDHIHRYKEDFALMKELGIPSYRFSVSWPKIMPEGRGKVNEKAIATYRDMIITMKENGITPYLTMFHWETPQALEDVGGWKNPEIVTWFEEYARVIAENFSDLVEYFLTINEPQCFVGLGYVTGVHAPGKQLPLKDTLLIAHNALKAHGAAVKALRKYALRPIKVGYAPTCTVAIPETESPEDIQAAKDVYFSISKDNPNWAWNVTWFSDPVLLGKYPADGLEIFKNDLPEITDEDMELISQPLDFIGQNIYNGYYIRAGIDGKPEHLPLPVGTPENSMGWPSLEECLYWGAKFAYDRYQIPIYITENGMACHDAVFLDGKVHDPNRIDFLDRYISALQRAADEGADIRGYFLWSFLDNFEWDFGYHGRFGIVYVDYKTQKRIPKDSAYWYKEIIASNGAKLYRNRKEVNEK